MAKIEMTPISKDKALAIEALTAYKNQNPVKYEAKKEALFARYGLNDTNEIEKVEDENDIELKNIKANINK